MGERGRGGLAALGWLALLALSATGCAKVAAPTGGPEDRTLPRVVAMAPDSGSVGARPDTISILFSKRMDRRSVRDWLYICPYLPIADTIWKGDRCDIVLDQRPDSGRTYVVLLGSQVVDQRKNPLGPWTAPFSTGRAIDTGRIEGTIRTVRLKSANVYLYVWPWADSLREEEGEIAPPLRMGQSAKDGRFRLEFLPRGVPLRLCALYDNRNDRSFDPDEDVWGCFGEAITLDDTTSTRSGIDLYLVYPDEPGVLKGAAVDGACARGGGRALRDLRREADSLAVVLEARARGDTLGADTLLGFGSKPRPAIDTVGVRTRLVEIGSSLPAAIEDSARCAVPVIVRLLDRDSTLVSEAQGDGSFEFRDVEPGIYRIAAFRDSNSDGEPGVGEPSGAYPYPVELAPGRTLEDLKFPLRAGP